MGMVEGVIQGETITYEIARKITSRNWSRFFLFLFIGLVLLGARGVPQLIGLVLVLHSFTNLWGTRRVPMVVCTDRAFYLRNRVEDEKMRRMSYKHLADSFLISQQKDNKIVQVVNIVTDSGDRLSFTSHKTETAADVVSCLKANIKAAMGRHRVVEKKIIERERIIEKAATTPKAGAGKGSNRCSYCGATFVRKMSSCPHCGADLTSDDSSGNDEKGKDDVETKLIKLRKLHDKGLVSDESFKKKEQQLLDKL